MPEATWRSKPDDVNELVPALWSAGVSKVNGVLTVAGLTAAEIAAEFGTPSYVVDEDDFRADALNELDHSLDDDPRLVRIFDVRDQRRIELHTVERHGAKAGKI